MGDTVSFSETKPARLKITGRTSYCLSAFGEHLIADEVEDAVSTASDSINSYITDYSVGAIFPKSQSELGGHLFIIEFKEQPHENQIKEFAEVLDKRLAERNEDYGSHRSDGFGLNKPTIRCVKKDTFSGWMKERGKLGGQHKVPRLISKQELFNNLTEYSKNKTILEWYEK